MEVRNYDGGVDYKFLKAMDIKVVKYQPWQLGLFHPDLKGKFLWYPRKGTLMYQEVAEGTTHGVKIGNTGEFCAGGHKQWWKEGATEMVYEEIMKKVNEQQHENV